MGENLFLLLVLLLLLAAGTATRGHGAGGLVLEVDNQACPGLFLVPLKASQVWLLKLVISLQGVSSVK